MEDLDNRDRRHNIWVRGLPEKIEPGQLHQATIFNYFLESAPETPIEIERLHRALRPRGRDTDPPRDVVSCIANLWLKEEILWKVKGRNRFLYHGAEIKLYQDLSYVTLQHRKDLRPLLEHLRARNITYGGKFPFCLSVTHLGRTVTLRGPEDVQPFFEELDLPPVLYSGLYLPPLSEGEPMEQQMQGRPLMSRRPRSPHLAYPVPANRRSSNGGSKPSSPAHHRARRDWNTSRKPLFLFAPVAPVDILDGLWSAQPLYQTL